VHPLKKKSRGFKKLFDSSLKNQLSAGSFWIFPREYCKGETGFAPASWPAALLAVAEICSSSRI
jgi:hypothetical protein